MEISFFVELGCPNMGSGVLRNAKCVVLVWDGTAQSLLSITANMIQQMRMLEMIVSIVANQRKESNSSCFLQ